MRKTLLEIWIEMYWASLHQTTSGRPMTFRQLVALFLGRVGLKSPPHGLYLWPDNRIAYWRTSDVHVQDLCVSGDDDAYDPALTEKAS